MDLKLCMNMTMTARLPKANKNIRRVGLGAFIEKENTTWLSKTYLPERYSEGAY